VKGNGATDRLGDAIRKLAGGLVECGKGNCRLTVELADTVAHFELRLVKVTAKRRRGLRRVGGVLVIDSKKRSAPSA
jgi:hypothetical protein